MQQDKQLKKEMKEIYETLDQSRVECLVVKGEYFNTLKKRFRKDTRDGIGPIYGIPVVVVDDLDVPYRFVFKPEYEYLSKDKENT